MTDVPALPFAWDRDRLVVVDQAAQKRLRRTKLSASTAKAMHGCPARYAAEKLLRAEDDPFGAAEQGTSGHTVLERLFALPASQRTRAKAASFVPELAAEIDFTKIVSEYPPDVLRAKWMSGVIDKYEGLWDIEDPTKVLVRRTEMSIDNVEIEGVPFIGFIDRCDVIEAEDGIGIRVVDYKTGRYKHANDRFGDDHGDQIRLYVDALEAADGRAPVEGHLYYTGFGKSRKVSLRPADRRKTRREFVNSWKLLTGYQDEQAYPCKSGPLCGWCPLVNVCPVATRDGFVARVEGLPEASMLPVKVLAPLTEVEITFDVDDLARHADEAPTEPADREPSPFIVPDLDMVNVDHHEDFFTDPELPEVEPELPDAEPPVVDDEPVADVAEVTDSGRRSADSGIEEGEGDEPVPAPPAPVGANGTAAHIRSAIEQSTTEGAKMLTEGKPWDVTGPDGKLNPASYASIAAFGIVELAVEELNKAGIPLKGSTVSALAGTYAHVIEACQEELTGSTSMQDGANTRLRGALRCTLQTLPLPFGQSQDAWDAWVAKAITRTGAIAKAAIRLWENGPGDSPWTVLAVRDASSQSA